MSELLHGIVRLADELPQPDALASHEDQARAVLRHLLACCGSHPATPAVVLPSQCPNCGVVTPSIRSPYCSTECREEAGFIRQFRQALIEGTIYDPERQVAFGQIYWHLLGGGRPLRRSLLSEKEIAKVIAKADGKCAECGQPATTVDHIGTACNRPINLRAVCKGCCRIHEFGDLAVLASGREQLVRYAERITAPMPIRICDAAEWDWRDHLRQRKLQFI